MPPTPATTTRKKRLHLLEETDRAALYDRPIFNDADRLIAFTLSDAEAERFPRLSDDLLHAWFILQLGYFKAKQRFFPLALPTMLDDLQYILAYLGSPMETADLRIPNPHTTNRSMPNIPAANRRVNIIKYFPV
ncbi:DUF4158 domain-containing protein [Herpetosiphon geysericola]|uniref:DUF4158 domain-containing protein n=1 Tax=Herpetosiphon geysericola TaxID=70996 RepID=A0A0P6XJ43_9CHLR|nr:DUF4158 domain-containing protein [Herpetosiphon geysericola]KPL79943.1 hypothetical protein SE18_25455 [Herpetosiphon geysericola]